MPTRWSVFQHPSQAQSEIPCPTLRAAWSADREDRTLNAVTLLARVMPADTETGTETTAETLDEPVRRS